MPLTSTTTIGGYSVAFEFGLGALIQDCFLLAALFIAVTELAAIELG